MGEPPRPPRAAGQSALRASCHAKAEISARGGRAPERRSARLSLGSHSGGMLPKNARMSREKPLSTSDAPSRGKARHESRTSERLPPPLPQSAIEPWRPAYDVRPCAADGRRARPRGEPPRRQRVRPREMRRQMRPTRSGRARRRQSTPIRRARRPESHQRASGTHRRHGRRDRHSRPCRKRRALPVRRSSAGVQPPPMAAHRQHEEIAGFYLHRGESRDPRDESEPARRRCGPPRRKRKRRETMRGRAQDAPAAAQVARRIRAAHRASNRGAVPPPAQVEPDSQPQRQRRAPNPAAVEAAARRLPIADADANAARHIREKPPSAR